VELLAFIEKHVHWYLREKMVIGDRVSNAPFLNCMIARPLETVPSGKMRTGQADPSFELAN